jgi:MFS family permease
VGIVLATFFSDVSHEMATAVLPFLVAGANLGAAGLGIIEGVADFMVSLSKLAGGALGHRLRRKRPAAALGYLLTSLATAAIGVVHTLGAMVSLRTAAWMARGFRGPLRDYLLADAVEETHYGRAYGLERAGDMLGAVTGPLLATLLLFFGLSFGTVILWTLVPGVAAAACMYFLTREREEVPRPSTAPAVGAAGPRFPRAFWLFLVGVLFFGLGDFSRTFLIYLAARAYGEQGPPAPGTVSFAILLFAAHNLISALAALGVGHLGDRRARLPLLTLGYGLGVVTNVLLAFAAGAAGGLAAAVALSAIYVAVEETLEKAVAAELLPRERRSLGFGILASVNAVGDMASSLYVGFALDAGAAEFGFGLAALLGAAGVLWLGVLSWRLQRRA